MERAIALCKGGPLDGVVLSVELAEDRQPQPLESRRELCGVLYIPSCAVALPDGHAALFVDGADRIDHDLAFEYVPEET